MDAHNAAVANDTPGRDSEGTDTESEATTTVFDASVEGGGSFWTSAAGGSFLASVAGPGAALVASVVDVSGLFGFERGGISSAGGCEPQPQAALPRNQMSEYDAARKSHVRV
jgi:hypothetical protein